MNFELSFGSVTPSLPAYGRHLFFCIHGNCAPSASVAALIERVNALNNEHDRTRFSNQERILITQSGCLGVCIGGPVLVVYPDGVWYSNVDVAKLERIYQEHLLGWKPVEEYMLHRHYPPGQEAAYAPGLRPEQPVDPFLLLAEQAAAEKAAQRAASGPRPVSDRVRAARERRQNRAGG